MVSHPIRVLSVCLVLGAAQPAFAAISMRVISEVHTEPAKGAKIIPPDTREVQDVTLADDYITIDKPGARVIYDFKARRYYVMDTAHKVYVDYSLYSVVGFRVMELKHRASMNTMLTAAKVELPPTRDVDREQELSVAENGDAKIDESAGEGTKVFSSEGSRLAEWSTRGAKVAASDAAHFARFLRYTQAGHPQLLDRLGKGESIPERLAFTVNNMVGVRTVRVSVADVRSVSPGAYTLDGYTLRSNATDPVDALLDRMQAQTPEQLAALRAKHRCDTEADYRDDQLLDSMLGRTECVIAEGAPMLPFTPAQMELMRADGSVALMFAAVSPKNKEEYAAAVKTLMALRREAPRKGYVLKLFEANNRLHLNERKESLQLFGEVFAANPVLGGAYKDLGDLLLTQFDSARAWRSWDIGRTISPKVPNFEAVTKLEAELFQRHPEFF